MSATMSGKTETRKMSAGALKAKRHVLLNSERKGNGWSACFICGNRPLSSLAGRLGGLHGHSLVDAKLRNGVTNREHSLN
jgi:hypothetical protein